MATTSIQSVELLDDPKCLDDSWYGGIKADIIQGLKYEPKASALRVLTVNKYEVIIGCAIGAERRTATALQARRTLTNRVTVEGVGAVKVQLRRRVTQEDRDEQFDHVLTTTLAHIETDMRRVLARFSSADELGYNLSWYAEEAMEVSALRDIMRGVRAHMAEETYTRETLLDYMAPVVREYEIQLLERQPWAQRSTSWSSNQYEVAKAKAMQKYRELYNSLQPSRAWGIDED